MLIPFPIFIPQFPYVKFVKEERYSPNEYLLVENKLPHQHFIDLSKRNKDLLLLNQVPIEKIHFVFSPMFKYDIETNKVNPSYKTFLPLRKDGSGLFDNTAPEITVDKPKKLVTVCVNNYKFDDNYVFLKSIVKSSKRGIAIFLADEICNDLHGAPFKWEFGVYTDILRLINLDDVAEQYKDYNFEPHNNS